MAMDSEFLTKDQPFARAVPVDQEDNSRAESFKRRQEGARVRAIERRGAHLICFVGVETRGGPHRDGRP